MHFPLMGLSFRPKSAKEVVAQFEKNQVLYLEREPDNEYDSSAIKVVWYPDEDRTQEPTHIGYVPSAQNADLAAYMDENAADLEEEPLTCIVTGVADPKKPTLYFDDTKLAEYLDGDAE